MLLSKVSLGPEHSNGSLMWGEYAWFCTKTQELRVGEMEKASAGGTRPP